MNQHVCQACQKNIATVHEFIVATKEEKHLCEECYQKFNLQHASQAMSIDSLKKIFLHGQTPEPSTSTHQGTACPACGMTINEFRKQGRFGCEKCYSAFGNQLSSLLESVHGDTHHIGMKPEEGQVEISLPAQHRQQVESLQQKLHAAIKAEDYEKAAQLRDKMNKLEEEKGE